MRTAESGTFTGNGHWRLKNVRATEIAMTGTKVTDLDAYTWETVLRPSLLTVYQVAPEKLELNTLWENMQLQDVLFSQGFGTRRVCAGLIQQGRVTVRGQPVTDAAAEFEAAA